MKILGSSFEHTARYTFTRVAYRIFFSEQGGGGGGISWMTDFLGVYMCCCHVYTSRRGEEIPVPPPSLCMQPCFQKDNYKVVNENTDVANFTY